MQCDVMFDGKVLIAERFAEANRRIRRGDNVLHPNISERNRWYSKCMYIMSLNADSEGFKKKK